MAGSVEFLIIIVSLEMVLMLVAGNKFDQKKIALSSLLTALFFLTTSLCLAQTPQEMAGDSAWAKRVEFVYTSRAKLEATSQSAIDNYQEAVKLDPNNYELRFKLIEALYYKGFFLTAKAEVRKELFNESVQHSRFVIESIQKDVGIDSTNKSLSPEDIAKKMDGSKYAARAYFWGAITWGLWGMSHTYVESGFQNVAGKMDHLAKVVVAIDSEYADGGGYRLLGRLYTVTPIIPIFSDWINREEGIKYLRKAIEISRKDVRNLVFLADALLKYQESNKAEAIELLEEACARVAEPEYAMEQQFEIDLGCKLLAEAKGQKG